MFTFGRDLPGVHIGQNSQNRPFKIYTFYSMENPAQCLLETDTVLYSNIQGYRAGEKYCQVLQEREQAMRKRVRGPRPAALR